MTPFSELMQQGAANAWFFVPSAILLGALHGLEPGHSKTMMAAFIVAVRGSVAQAVLLGLAATVSHTAVVWGIALAGLHLARDIDAQTSEPYFQLLSAALILTIALWMARRSWREQHPAPGRAHAHHGLHHHYHPHGHDHHHDNHMHSAPALEADGDAHQRAHASDIGQRFDGRPVTTWQIVLFGLTGGLIPCPAAVTVLLLCLQLREVTLGAALVLCFSIGLALTLVTVGVVAALGVRHASARMGWLSSLARRAPYASSVLIALVGLYVGYHGWAGLQALS